MFAQYWITKQGRSQKCTSKRFRSGVGPNSKNIYLHHIKWIKRRKVTILSPQTYTSLNLLSKYFEFVLNFLFLFRTITLKGYNSWRKHLISLLLWKKKWFQNSVPKFYSAIFYRLNYSKIGNIFLLEAIKGHFDENICRISAFKFYAKIDNFDNQPTRKSQHWF